MTDLVRGVGAVPRPTRTLAGLEALLPEVDAAIVDLTARGYDGMAAVALASAAGRRILAVGQHDDRDARQRALAAGADRVLPYRRLHEDGPRQIATWLAAPTPVDAARPVTSTR